MKRNMKVEASVKSVRISARKARLVIDEVRGMSALDAERSLSFMNKKAAEIVLKVLRSAMANAEHNNKLKKEDLVIVEIIANEGFTIKRFRPRAFGRAAMIRKRTSHIRIVLDESPEAQEIAKKAAAEKKKKKPAVKKVTTAKKAPAKKAVVKKVSPKKKAAKKESK